MGSSSYLIDLEGNLWSFGFNGYGQLGIDRRTKRFIRDKNAPKLAKNVKDIQQIASGCHGFHILAKNSQNQIFVTGNNNYGQLGAGYKRSVLVFEELNSQYSSIWRDEHHSRVQKSARK